MKVATKLLIVSMFAVYPSCVGQQQPPSPGAQDSLPAKIAIPMVPPTLAYRASGTVITGQSTEPRIVIAVRIQNVGTADVVVGVGGCGGAKLRVYPASGPIGVAKWDQEAWEHASMRLCNDVLFEHVIAPAQFLILKDSVPLSGVLGDSLPRTGYFLSAFLRLNSPAVEVPIGVRLLRP